MTKHDTNQQTAIDILAAREATTIDVAKTREFLYDGHEKWEAHRNLVGALMKDAIFSKADRTFMTRTERYNRGLAMSDKLLEIAETCKWTAQETANAFNIVDEALPMLLHTTAFEPVISSQGSPELISKYGALIAMRGILGCYMQTELGHGTNVASLETTATFIPETQEFEIHSPTLTSSKWWIGALGKTSTHGVVQAKLILAGENFGPHLFFVQLRSLENHEVLPGIIIGDIGPKAMNGFCATDNGFVRFDRIRIPKVNMLSKFAQVTVDGKYVQPPHSKISYGGMLYIRSGMVTVSGWTIAKAATISIRYATVRRQGEKGADGLERQVITYPSVFYRLLPILSRAYVFIQLGRNLTTSFDAMSARLASGDTSLLAEIHAITSGLKVLVTTTGIQDLEVARRSMGGHGYSAFAGIGRMYADYLPSATYEGDNFVLDGQVVRAALKSYRMLFPSTGAGTADISPSVLAPSSHYLRLLLNVGGTTPRPPQLSSTRDWKNPAHLVLLLEWRAALIVHDIAQNSQALDAGVSQRVSKAVTEAFVGAQIADIMAGLESDDAVLQRLFLLYLLTTVETALVDLLSFGLLPSSANPPTTSGNGTLPHDTTKTLRMAVLEVSQEILPNAIGLTDAFGFSDWELDSALGVYDGKVYEALWSAAQTEPLNKQEITEAYERSIKPILLRGQRLAKGLGAKL